MGNPNASTTSKSAHRAKAQERISGAAPGDRRGASNRTASASFSAQALSRYLSHSGSTRCSSASRMSLHATARSVTARRDSPRRTAVSNRARHALVVQRGALSAASRRCAGVPSVAFPRSPRDAAVAPDALLAYAGFDGRPRLHEQPHKRGNCTTPRPRSRLRHERNDPTSPCRTGGCAACHYPFHNSTTSAIG